jgi:hypothetical protein
MTTGCSPWKGAHHDVGACGHRIQEWFHDFAKLTANPMADNGISYPSPHSETHTNWLINLTKQAMNDEIGTTSTRTLAHSQREVS